MNDIFFRGNIRSAINFIIFVIIAFGTTIFILAKADQATQEIERLSDVRLVLAKEGGETGTEVFPEDKKVCTQEAKLCPNGSYVSRIGPNCEFAECLRISDHESRIIKLRGYYGKRETNKLGGAPVTCSVFIVTGGDEIAIQEYSKLVRAGNKINAINSFGNLLFSLEISQLDPSRRSLIISSRSDREIEITLQEKPRKNIGVDACFSFANILEVRDYQDSSAWKTYRNEKYGFEVRYPDEWSFRLVSEPSQPERIYLENQGSSILIAPLGWPVGLPGAVKIENTAGIVSGRRVSIEHFLTEDNVEWGRLMRLIEYPAVWNESNFILVQPEFNIIEQECDVVCAPKFGKLNTGDSKVAYQILSTFKFIK